MYAQLHCSLSCRFQVNSPSRTGTAIWRGNPGFSLVIYVHVRQWQVDHNGPSVLLTLSGLGLRMKTEGFYCGKVASSELVRMRITMQRKKQP